MAIRYAVATGVWSNTATWNGGTLPTSADDIFSNNFIVTVDQDITASSLRNTSNVSPAITAGGHFNVTGSTGTRTITLTGTTGTGGSSPSGIFSFDNVTAAFRIASTSGATVNVSSPLGAPQTGIGSTAEITGNATINWVGTYNIAIGFYRHWFINTPAANGTLNIVGNILGGASTTLGVINRTAANYTVNITGNVTAGSNAGILIQAASIINVTGNVTGAANNGITFNGGTATVTVTGNVNAGTVAGISNNSTNSTFIINGNVTASSANNGIIGNVIGTLVTVNGNLTNTSNYMAVLALKMRISPTAQQTWTYQTAGPNRQMFTANAFSGGTMPVASDVRLGVSYAGGSLSGTCAVPSANSVAFGVPVDNTTGNAVITRAQLFSDTGAIIAAYPQIN
jgi:hypothetical protein